MHFESRHYFVRLDICNATGFMQRLPPRARQRRPNAPAAAPHLSALIWRAALVPVGFLLLLLVSLPPAHGHDQQAEAGEPVPQATLDTVLWERSQGLEQRDSFPKWFGQQLRENSLSEAIRDRIYDDEVEKLNPTCSVIGFLLRTIPVCPVVRKLEECE